LASLAAHFNCFILDALGVLNRGETAIPGVVERIKELRQLGKKLIVPTNAASYTRTGILSKYQRFGFSFVLKTSFPTGILPWRRCRNWGAVSIGPRLLHLKINSTILQHGFVSFWSTRSF